MEQCKPAILHKNIIGLLLAHCVCPLAALSGSRKYHYLPQGRAQTCDQYGHICDLIFLQPEKRVREVANLRLGFAFSDMK